MLAIHPPDYRGVASATRRLFPCSIAVGPEDLWLDGDRRALIEAIDSVDPDVIVLSGFAEGYVEVARACQALRPGRALSVLWHGSPMQLVDAEERRHYRAMLELARDGVVARIGTFKTGQGEALKARGYDAVDVFNPPPAGSPVEGKARGHREPKAGGRIGLFFAGPSWRKNPYAMLEACARVGELEIHGVLDVHAQAHARSIGLRLQSVRERPWSTAELRQELGRVDLNLYVGLSECSPLLPLESLHLGVPCLVGPTSHLFVRSPLAPSDEAARGAADLLECCLVVARPDDPAAIAAGMEAALERSEEIRAAYGVWHAAYRAAAWASVERFVGGALPRGGVD